MEPINGHPQKGGFRVVLEGTYLLEGLLTPTFLSDTSQVYTALSLHLCYGSKDWILSLRESRWAKWTVSTLNNTNFYVTNSVFVPQVMVTVTLSHLSTRPMVYCQGSTVQKQVSVHSLLPKGWEIKWVGEKVEAFMFQVVGTGPVCLRLCCVVLSCGV